MSSVDDDLRRAGPHRKRAIRFEQLASVGDWQIKIYSIAARDPARLIEETVRRAAEVYPTPARATDRYGVGFAIAHAARGSSIALYYWWASFNECHQRIFVGPEDEPGAMTPMRDPAAGCVWELEVVDFERRAWLTDVLANPDGPDVARYLTRQLVTEV